MLKGNKGEWAELYVFLKILSETKLASADENLEIEIGKFFEFLSLIWNDTLNGTLVYQFENNNIKILTLNDDLKKTMPRAQVTEKLGRIFSEIITSKGPSFSIPEAEQLMGNLLRTTLKAPSSEKADIFGTIIDRNTNTAELSGFSVKSMLQNQATLLNASGQTLFRYHLTGISPEQAAEISEIGNHNSKSKYIDRTKRILEYGGTFQFHSMLSQPFERTLRKIDTMLPEFVAEMLVGFFSKKGRSLDQLVNYLATSKTIDSNFNFSLDKDDYKFKLKQLLAASALGMQPKKIWDGMMRANGGYLILIQSGDVLCYHAFNRDVFLNYLFNNTAFESPAGRKSPYLEMIQIGDEIYTDLKLQIRFTK